MTRAEFRDKFGADWKKLISRPWWTAFMAVVDKESPARQLHTKKDGDKLHGSPYYIGEIAGYEALRRLLETLGTDTPDETDIPTEYSKSEILPPEHP